MDATAIVFAFLSAVLMGTIGVFSKITGLPAEIITFFRLMLGALFMILFVSMVGKLRLLRQWPTMLVLLSGVFLAGFIIFYVQAMNFTSMANAIMLVYLAPLMASIAAHYCLGERLTRSALGLIVLALFGFSMMMEFSLEVNWESREFIGMCFGFSALLSYGGFILVNRMIRQDEHVYCKTFYQLFIGGCVMVPFISESIHDVTMEQLPWLFAVGFFPGFLAIFFAVAALSRLPTAMFGTIAYTEPVAVVIFGWAIFQETLSPMQLAGCLLIIASGIIKTVTAKRTIVIKPLPGLE